ncbi:MAG: hypothetical protein EOM54_11400 [Clostridia bacterium]|nr:hypothetical protein [Clostridia bacterium]
MAKIVSPVEGYSGVSAGVSFDSGVGYTNDTRLIDWFQRKGYTIESDIQEDPNFQDGPEPSVPEPPIPGPPVPEPAAPELPQAEAIPETAEQESAAPLSAPSPFDKMTTADLKAYAEKHGIDISGVTAKSNILAKIKAAESGK